MLPRLVALIVLLSLSLVQNAAAQGLFLDNFDDGIIAPIYNDLCQTEPVESGGAFLYPGPILGCFAIFGFFPASIIEVLEPGLIVPNNVIDFEIRIDRIPTILLGQPSGELVGIGLNPIANTGLGLNFFLQRFPGTLELVLFDPESQQRVGAAVVSSDPDQDSTLAAASTIVLRLSLGENFANEIFPIASYRLCGPGTCVNELEPPFVELAEDPGGVGFGAVALTSAPRLTIQGVAQVGEAGAFAIERLAVPEPAPSWMLLPGCLGLVSMVSRRRRHARRVSYAGW